MIIGGKSFRPFLLSIMCLEPVRGKIVGSSACHATSDDLPNVCVDMCHRLVRDDIRRDNIPRRSPCHQPRYSTLWVDRNDRQRLLWVRPTFIPRLEEYQVAWIECLWVHILGGSRISLGALLRSSTPLSVMDQAFFVERQTSPGRRFAESRTRLRPPSEATRSHRTASPGWYSVTSRPTA